MGWLNQLPQKIKRAVGGDKKSVPEGVWSKCSSCQSALSAQSSEELTLYATIIDYSKQGLVPTSPKLHWRVQGEERWREMALNATDNNTHFNVQIPTKITGKVIEYYISATSKLGRSETMPRTAPKGFYTVERR